MIAPLRATIRQERTIHLRRQTTPRNCRFDRLMWPAGSRLWVVDWRGDVIEASALLGKTAAAYQSRPRAAPERGQWPRKDTEAPSLRSSAVNLAILAIVPAERAGEDPAAAAAGVERPDDAMLAPEAQHREVGEEQAAAGGDAQDRKSTRLNSSH